MKEYLSLLQCLLYKAQKRQKRKQILKFQKIFYKSQSIIFFILRNKTLKNAERKKIQSFLSEPMFQKFVKICILKKQTQICYFSNSKLPSRKKLINFKENFQNFSFSPLFFESKNKQLFSINFVLCHHNLKLTYLSFYNNSINWNRNSLRHLKLEFFSLFNSLILLLFLPTQNFLLLAHIARNKKKKFLLKKSNIDFFNLGRKYQSFNYQTFYDFYFYHHNYFLDSKKTQYQNNFDLLSNRKQKLFKTRYARQKKENIKINKNHEFEKNCFLNYKNKIYKNNNFCYYSTILNYPFFRQNSFFISSKLLNNLFFNNFNKSGFFEIQLNNIQKQILFFIFEPVWEAYFEIASYSKRRGRSLYDAVGFIRSNLKKQPMFLFKIYLNILNKMIYKNIEKNRKFKYNLSLKKKPVVFDKYDFLYNKIIFGSLFFNFIQNIIFYGIQKQYQNYYLKTKQQVFLYQILKIFKQNNQKNDIYFYKIFYNKIFCILTIQNKIQKRFQNSEVIDNYFIINYKKFIIEYHKNIPFNKFKNNNVELNQVINLKLESYFITNFLTFSLSNFFKEKITYLKQRLFSIELKKQKFPFYFEKLVSTFFPRNTYLSKSKGVSFSMIYKDSSFFVSKNTFLFFFIKKNKKVFLNLLNQWNKENFYFFKKNKNNTVLLKKFQCQMNNTINEKKVMQVFVFSKKKYPARWNLLTLLKINFSFIYGYFHSLNRFLNLDSFNNIFLTFLLFIKKIFFYSNLLKENCSFKNNNFFLIMYYCNLYGKIFSFFPYNFKTRFIIFLLEHNDIKLIWNIFIKYGNQILYFNSNYTFLKSFQTILKKWIIFNKIFLFLYVENKKKYNISPVLNILLHSKYFLLNQKDWLIFYLKETINKKLNLQKCNPHYSALLWSLKLFVMKEKHTFLVYKKKINGFDFLNFFMFHTNKKNKTYISNSLFFWQFYFLKSLKHFKYIKSFINYFQIYEIHKKQIVINKQIKQRIRFIFFQSLFLNYLFFSEYNNFLGKLINFSFQNQNKFSSFHLFKLIFRKIIKNKSTLIFYKKLIQQQTLKMYYYFSIKPSKYHIEKHLFKIYHIVKKSHNKTQEYLIFKLSKTIKNWCYYYQIITPTILFKYLDYLTLQILWRWACKRHYQKSKKWIKMKYFYKFNFINTTSKYFSVKNYLFTNLYTNKRIVFASQINLFINLNMKNYKINLFKKIFDKKEILSNIHKISKRIFICLPNHSDVILIKHKLIQNDRSPFDGDFLYWIPRNFYD